MSVGAKNISIWATTPPGSRALRSGVGSGPAGARKPGSGDRGGDTLTLPEVEDFSRFAAVVATLPRDAVAAYPSTRVHTTTITVWPTRTNASLMYGAGPPPVFWL